MRLLVLGGTGGVGRHLLGQALERGHGVRAVVRDGSGLPPGLEVVRGEVLSPGVLRDAVRGCDAVVSALGQRRRSLFPWSPLVSPPDLCGRSASLLAVAMREAGLTRIVVVSAAGVGDSEPRMSPPVRWLILGSTIGISYRDLARMEEVLAAAGLDWTAPRPVTLTHGRKTGRVREVEAFTPSLIISRADVAAWMLDAVERPGATLRTPQLAGG